MAAFIGRTLMEGGIEPSFAYYYPYSRAPELSVPAYRVFTRSVKARVEQWGGARAHAIGAWLPELEFMHYFPTRHWRELIGAHAYHLSVSGNCLAATPYARTGMRFWSWVATPWKEDREARTRAFSAPRRLVDRLVNAGRAQRLEKQILASRGTLMALSRYTEKKLDGLVPGCVSGTLPMGIDTELFSRVRAVLPRTSPRVGFVGRVDDPRKNIELLLAAIKACRLQGADLTLVLVGAGEHRHLDRLIGDFGLGGITTVIDHVDNADLPEVFSSMDVFVVPSTQEGLCIAALEAMSCGVPVVSTRCGGPEEFVIDGETGLVVELEPQALAEALVRLLTDRSLAERLARKARALVEKSYSVEYAQQVFWESFNATFSLAPSPASGPPPRPSPAGGRGGYASSCGEKAR